MNISVNVFLSLLLLAAVSEFYDFLSLDPGNSWTYVDLENGDFEEVVLAKNVCLDDKEYIQSNRFGYSKSKGMMTALESKTCKCLSFQN
jgi:hypothetical protein